MKFKIDLNKVRNRGGSSSRKIFTLPYMEKGSMLIVPRGSWKDFLLEYKDSPKFLSSFQYYKRYAGYMRKNT